MFNSEATLSMHGKLLSYVSNFLSFEVKSLDDTTVRLNQIRHSLICIENKIDVYIDENNEKILNFGDQDDKDNLLKLKNIFAKYKYMKLQNQKFFLKNFSMHENYIENEKEKYTINNFNELFNTHKKLSLDSSSMNIIVVTNMLSFLKKIRRNTKISSTHMSVDEFNKFKDYMFKVESPNQVQSIEILISSKE